MIDDEVAAAMKWARTKCGRTPEQWARELTRLTPNAPIGLPAVLAVEAGKLPPLACWLIAAARLVEQPVSVLLGEMEMYEVTMPALERRLGELEARLEAAGLA